jgi:hypothetical protein
MGREGKKENGVYVVRVMESENDGVMSESDGVMRLWSGVMGVRVEE